MTLIIHRRPSRAKVWSACCDNSNVIISYHPYGKPRRLTQLRTFVAIAQAGSVGAAARQLLVSQRTLTMQIRLLEEKYGVELFHRLSRGVELTETGRQLFALTGQLASIVSEAVQLLKDAGDLRSGRLIVGAVSPYQVTDMLAEFSRKYPAMRVRVRFGNSEYRHGGRSRLYARHAFAQAPHYERRRLDRHARLLPRGAARRSRRKCVSGDCRAVVSYKRGAGSQDQGAASTEVMGHDIGLYPVGRLAVLVRRPSARDRTQTPMVLDVAADSGLESKAYSGRGDRR